MHLLKWWTNKLCFNKTLLCKNKCHVFGKRYQSKICHTVTFHEKTLGTWEQLKFYTASLLRDLFLVLLDLRNFPMSLQTKGINSIRPSVKENRYNRQIFSNIFCKGRYFLWLPVWNLFRKRVDPKRNELAPKKKILSIMKHPTDKEGITFFEKLGSLIKFPLRTASLHIMQA